MGWIHGNWPTQAALIEELVGEGYGKTIAHQVVGNNLWCVQESFAGHHVRQIVLFKLERLCGRWGYKVMAESEGPYESNCPIEFIELVERARGGAPIGFASRFRERVKAYHGGHNPAQGVLI